MKARSARFAVALVLGSVASIVSCGGSALVPNDGGQPVDAAVETASDGAPDVLGQGDGSSVSDSTAGDATGAVDAAPPNAFIAFETAPSTGAFAAQFDSPQGLPYPECSVLVPGGQCQVTSCPQASDAGAVTNAGTLTISGGLLDGGIAVEPGVDGLYQWYPPYAGDHLFAPGQTLTVSASGADVPPFGPEAIAGPAPIDLTAPQLPGDGGKYVLATGQDLNVAWTGGTAGDEVVIEVTGYTNSFTIVTAECRFDATAAAGVVPHSALAYLQGLSQGRFSGARCIAGCSSLARLRFGFRRSTTISAG